MTNASAGSYSVPLTITIDDGAIGTDTQQGNVGSVPTIQVGAIKGANVIVQQP